MRFRVVALVAIVMSFPLVAEAQLATFRSAFLASNGGRTPSDLGLGDFNGDGQLDVVTANSNAGSVTIFLQFDGDLFADHDELVGNVPTAVTVAAFDADGSLDLVVANGNDGSLKCLHGNGDGSFAAAGDAINVPGNPVALATGDVDKDGKIDVLVGSGGASESAPGSVSIVRGLGDCTFEVQTTLETQTGTTAVELVDVDGDEKLDILAVNSRSATVSVFLARAGGEFVSQPVVPTGPEPQDLAAGDLDGDGALDIVTADKNGDSITVLLGNGSGGFTHGPAYQAGTAPSGVALDDLTGDGVLDAVVTNNFSGDVSVLVGDGSGGFRTARNFVAEGQPIAVTLGQMDGDGRLDVVTANLVGSDGSVAVLRNRGGGALWGVEDVLADTGPSSVTIGDLDADGLADAVVTHDSGTVYTFASTPDGARRSQAFDLGGRPRGSALADFNGDLRLDLAVADNERNVVTVFLGLRNGSLGSGHDYVTGPAPAGVGVGDFDGDGKVDLVLPSFGPPGEISVLLGQGDGTFSAPCATPTGDAPVDLTVADFNKDGLDDAAVVNQGAETVNVLTSDGDCSFTLRATLGAAQGLRGPTSVVSRLFDADLIPDLAVGNSITSGIQPTVLVFLGNGDGSFRSGSSSRADRVDSMDARDFTGDGLVDLVTTDQTSNTVRVLRGRGDGRFSAESTTLVSRMPIAVAAGDTDGDGRYDAITANAQSTANNLSLLSNCVGDPGCTEASGTAARRGDGNGDDMVSAADFVAIAREIADDDGGAVEDIARAGYLAVRGVDANGDGLIDGQDGPAAARWLFDPART